ncbi:MAG: DUF4136 domain-containing protein [Methylococcaceae bacterium]|jgi:hypothetical protein|nr:DUF4136 domain-containing protein [Methylococcaceae bacterium]
MQFAGKILLASALFLSACSSVEVRTDHDNSVDFSRYTTYAWKQLPATSYPLMDNRIVAAVDGQLFNKGWRRVPEMQAQTILAASVTTREGQRVDTVHNNWGGPGMHGWGWGGPVMSTARVVSYTVGTLVLDLYDAQSHNAIWRGTASDVLWNNPQRLKKSLDKGVKGMFDKFPPGIARVSR